MDAIVFKIVGYWVTSDNDNAPFYTIGDNTKTQVNVNSLFYSIMHASFFKYLAYVDFSITFLKQNYFEFIKVVRQSCWLMIY